MPHATSTRRGQNQDSIYWGATKNCYAGAVRPGQTGAGETCWSGKAFDQMAGKLKA